MTDRDTIISGPIEVPWPLDDGNQGRPVYAVLVRIQTGARLVRTLETSEGPKTSEKFFEADDPDEGRQDGRKAMRALRSEIDMYLRQKRLGKYQPGLFAEDDAHEAHA